MTPLSSFRAGEEASPSQRLAVPPRAELGPAALVRALAANEPRAAARLWDEFAPMVRRIVLRALGRSTEVDDVVQDVFLRLFRTVPSLRQPEALKGYVIKVTIRRVSTEITKRRLRRWLLLTPTGTLPEVEVPYLAEEGRSQDAVRHLWSILDRLDDRDRLAFVLRHVEELELTEVAQLLGASLATVKRRLSRASATIAAALRADEGLREFLGMEADASPPGEVP